MMTFPFTLWKPLSVSQVHQLFEHAPFAWGFAGGYAIEHFLGTAIRPHDDIDIVVFRQDQRQLYDWLHAYRLFAADPPGTLRPWDAAEWLAFGIHDIWAYQHNASAWQLQIMFLEAEGDAWFSRRDPGIRGLRRELLVDYQQLPCVRVEVQLYYKARGNREKDQQDFRACLPLLTPGAKAWLKQALQLEHPHGHAWLAELA
ncbi:MAG: hypothetical protein KF832_20545 [Caldilineaceae bacterium]|nr:hypothetical protein [Caldilineaceae bacterium]